MAVDFSVQNQNVQSQTSSTYTTSTTTTQASGTLAGQTVRNASDPMSLLAKIAEEMTFAADTTDEFELEERKEKETIELRNTDLIRRYSEILKDSGKSDKFQELKEQIMSLKSMQQTQMLLQMTKEATDDSGQAYVFLRATLEEFTKDGVDPAILAALQEAIDIMERDEMPAIVTAMQVGLTVFEDGSFGVLENPAELYTKSIHEFTTPQQVYSYINENYDGKIDVALDFLYKALGNDLSSDISSADKTKLENVGTSLGELRAFQSAHALCERFVDRLASVHQIETCPFSSFELLGKVLDMSKEVYLSSSSVDRLARDSKLENPEQEVFFLQELQTVARQFSPTLFDSMQERTKVLDAIQGAVDAAVEKEDEWLASME